MYKSKEIRWFDKEENYTILEWFAEQGINFSTIQARTDFYLPLPDREDISIKLREGNIEIKKRHGHPLLHELTENTRGYMEDWVKWSFDVEEADPLSNEIIMFKQYDWVEVYKERLGVKITLKQDVSWEIHDIKERLPGGCQLEYTRLKVNGSVWFTFAVEWFGEDFIELNKDAVLEVLGKSLIREEKSFGYNAFINKLA